MEGGCGLVRSTEFQTPVMGSLVMNTTQATGLCLNHPLSLITEGLNYDRGLRFLLWLQPDLKLRRWGKLRP